MLFLSLWLSVAMIGLDMSIFLLSLSIIGEFAFVFPLGGVASGRLGRRAITWSPFASIWLHLLSFWTWGICSFFSKARIVAMQLVLYWSCATRTCRRDLFPYGDVIIRTSWPLSQPRHNTLTSTRWLKKYRIRILSSSWRSILLFVCQESARHRTFRASQNMTSQF